MSNFQLAALAFFAVVLLATYQKTVVAAAQSLLSDLKRLAPKPSTPGNNPKTKEPSEAALEFVNDLLLVRDLRSRLDSCSCQEGVDACTILLRVMIESDYEKTEG